MDCGLSDNITRDTFLAEDDFCTRATAAYDVANKHTCNLDFRDAFDKTTFRLPFHGAGLLVSFCKVTLPPIM
jgi:hypothetical protein